MKITLKLDLLNYDPFIGTTKIFRGGSSPLRGILKSPPFILLFKRKTKGKFFRNFLNLLASICVWSLWLANCKYMCVWSNDGK